MKVSTRLLVLVGASVLALATLGGLSLYTPHRTLMNTSTEQTRGIDQVNQAIMGMDDATRQNAALVEEAAARAQSWQKLAAELAALVAVFRLGDGAGAPAAARREPALRLAA